MLKTNKKERFINDLFAVSLLFSIFAVNMGQANQATLDFIRQHVQADVRQLALQGCKNPEVDMTYALQQIAGRQTAAEKLPGWAAIDGIVYPPHLSMEQCSSEQTARYKASIAGGGRLMVDLTGGFGVDCFTMSVRFEQAVYVERQPQLCAVSSENTKALGLKNVTVVCADGADYLHQMEHADLIFVDPARRDEHGARTYGIADCTPNVLELMEELVTKARRILLKLSPMLDWRKAVADIEATGGARVVRVHIVSVSNECKELLLEVEGREKTTGRRVSGTEGNVMQMPVVCVNCLSDGTEERFVFDASSSSNISLSSLLSPLSPSNISLSSLLSPLSPSNISLSSLLSPLSSFLYEPNASVMKAGCFDEISRRFQMCQLERNSHLFVSDRAVDGFPGRCFMIERVTSMNKRELKAALAGVTHANIAVRNFPLTVADLRKRLKLKDGGEVYIFAATVEEKGHQLFICRKIG